MFVKVLLTRNTKAIDMAFTYHVSKEFESIIRKGHKVIVPFGKGDSLQEGYVLELTDQAPVHKTKDIYQIIEDVFLTLKQLEGIQWLRDTYLCTYSEAIQVFVPPGSRLIKKVTYEMSKDFEATSENQEKIYQLIKEGPVDEEVLKNTQLMSTALSLLKSKKIKKKVNFQQKVKTTYKKIVLCHLEKKDLEDALSQLSKVAVKQSRVLEFMTEVSAYPYTDLARELNINKSTLKPLVKMGYITFADQEVMRRPEGIRGGVSKFKFPLSPAQNQVFQQVACNFNKDKKFLLQGVTGSGKTEVYMALAEKVVASGKQVIILVPEIALTPQMVGKFYKRFGHNIGVVHSKLSMGERFDQYNSIMSSDIKIVIGARSAIFAPCNDLGLIIIDEAHESTYKSDSNPRYNTLEVAEFLSSQNNVPLLLASATPSVTTYFQTHSTYDLLKLDQRFNQKPLPKVHLVDMKEELIQGNKTIFSELLSEKIEDRLNKKEQIILFFNKKGFASFVSCRNCGYVVKCPRCDVSLTYHHASQESKCSYCDYKIKIQSHCPVCKSSYFKYFGSGTEKVESLIKERFPGAKVARLDSETTSKKGSLEAIISSVENQEVDILLGTQMVAKGLDFEKVTLVGALSADMSLNIPDYLASEKTFQLLTQVAGRAGRGALEGEVVIQTYTPEHFAIQGSVSQDYDAFYREEIKIREAYAYPPFVELANLVIVGPNEKRTIDSAFNLHRELKRFIKKGLSEEAVEILGPNPCIIQKINHKYRWQIILKFDKMDLERLRNIIHYVCIKHKKQVVTSDVYIGINMSPLNLL